MPSFDDLCVNFQSAPVVGCPSEAFRVPEPASSSFFVPPVLLAKDEQHDPAVTLLSARGAAGKSTTARELARRLEVPLWELHNDRAVGGTSLEYTLGNYLGTHDVPGGLARLARPLVVIDSLDEARARVSGVSWAEFVESLARLARHGLRFALFGRERTLEDVWVTLDELTVSAAWWEISHFAPEQCLEYVDRVVKKRDSQVDQSSRLYAEARDALIGSLRRASASDYSDAFVGYAPVLDAVAAMLIRKPNLLQIRQQFSTESTATDGRTILLQEILGKLLERERGKIESMATEVGLDPNLTYRPAEQHAWLCNHLEQAPTPALAYISDATKRANYIEQIETFAEEHPFRSDRRWASPVFEAYVAAAEFEKNSFSPSRQLEIGNTSGFLLEFVRNKPDLVISEMQFAALHASMIASDWIESTTTTMIEQNSDGIYDATFLVRRMDEPARVTQARVLAEESGVLRLYGPLAELTVHAEDTVVLPGESHETEIGPDLVIRGRSIRIEGVSLSFSRQANHHRNVADEASVSLEATESVHLPPTSARLPPANDLEIRVPVGVQLAHPWFEYRSDLPSQEEPDAKIIRLLNKLMNLTRAHGHDGERGAYVKKFEGRQPFATNDFHVALGALIDAGVVHVVSDIVYLRSEWEQHRYSGKAAPGQRSIDDVLDAWTPVIAAIETALAKN